MKKITLIALILTVGFANAQAFKGKKDTKFQVGMTMQEYATGIITGLDFRFDPLNFW